MLQEVQDHYPEWKLPIQLPPESPEDHHIRLMARSLAIGRQSPAPRSNWQGLRPLLESLKREQPNQPFEYQHFVPLQPLDINHAPFPVQQNPSLSSAIQQLNELGQQYENSRFQHPDSCLSLLEKYTTTLPCRYGNLPDTSLYDHVKMVGCLSACLKSWQVAHEQLTLSLELKQAPVLMLGADLSGIQRFIYDIVSKSAAKNLKGRSFYLELLVDSLIMQILNQLRLSRAHLIYASGGGFYLLAPNTSEVRQAIEQIQEMLSRKLFESHGMKLFLALDICPIRLQDFWVGNEGKEAGISQIWKQLIQQLNEKKRQRFANQLETNFQDFFMPHEAGGRRNRDAITNEEFTPEEEAEYLESRHPSAWEKICMLDRDTFNEPVKRNTWEQIELGRSLRDADYWLSTFHPLNTRIKTFNPCQMGVYHYFIRANQLESLLEDQLSDGPNIRLLQINNIEASDSLPANHSLIPGFAFYGGNRFPLSANQNEKFPASSEELAGDLDFKRVGLLRMDVDNLGQMFINGFSEDKKTFARYTALSRNLDFFFKGWLNKIVERYHPDAYILYAGGDDLFIVGRWDQCLRIARDIYRDFKSWCCQNSHLSISGGMSMVTPKFPIMLGAEYAAQAEELAKSHLCPVFIPNQEIPTIKEKNAFSLLGNPLNWNYEFEIVLSLKEQLYRFLTTSANRPSIFGENLLRKIQLHFQQQQYQRKQQLTQRWYWMLVYELSKYGRSLSKSHPDYEAARQFLAQIKKDAISNTHLQNQLNSHYTYLNLLFIAARWAELELRTLPT